MIDPHQTDRTLRRRPRHTAAAAVVLASALLAAGVGGGAMAGATTTTTPTPTSTATSPPSPKLRLSWSVLEHKCWTATTTVHIRVKKRVRVHGKPHTKTVTKTEKKHVHKCGQRPVRSRGRALHLRWRQHGEVFGHLTVAGQPVASAPITLNWTIPKHQSGTETVTTNASGRFKIVLAGPDKNLSISYAPAGGTAIVVHKRIQAAAFLSLKVGQLTAGKNGHFSGIVFGGHIPQDLYVQFWYYAGAAGWQPFSHLAIVDRHNGHWASEIPIPKAAAGYLYRIKASVVPSPEWPWADTDSRVLKRRVS